jgi:hypothetical protein
MTDIETRAGLVRLVRERFGPMTRFLGPLYAGQLKIGALEGPLWVGQGPVWIWGASRKVSEDAPLVDEDVASALAADSLVRNLLVSCSDLLTKLVKHLDLIEATDGCSSALLRYYLENPDANVVDGIALSTILGHSQTQTLQ